MDKYQKFLNQIDSIESKMGERVNDIAAYLFIIEYRANNAMGAKTLNQSFVQTTPDYNILNFAQEEGKLFLAPNGFPGYDEIINE